MEWIEPTKLLFQVLFWITMATIAILTYLRARKTLFQPMRTEIFKVQVQELANVLHHFVGKDELELRNDFAFEKMLHVNVMRMYDVYAKTFFDIDMPFEERPYNRAECPNSVVTQDFAEQNLVAADGHEEPSAKSETSEPDPRTRAALWDKYKHGELHIPREYTDHEKAISDLTENPLLPSRLATLLDGYLKIARENSEHIRKILAAAAPEMVDKYPNKESLTKSSFGWIHSRYVDDFSHFKPAADTIVAFIRGYYETDNLFGDDA